MAQFEVPSTSESPQLRGERFGKLSIDNLRFSKIDKNCSGTIELAELKTALPQLSSPNVEQLFAQADANNDGHLDREEFSKFLAELKSRTDSIIEYVVLPEGDRTLQRSLWLPIFIVTISIIQWAFYQYLLGEDYDIKRYLVFHPLKRYEVWRFLTPMFVHTEPIHIWDNLVMQLILGSFLEAVYHWKVVIVYLAGVIFGTLASSVFDPWAFASGASGGVYALIFAHLATIVLHWNEMGHALLRCFFFLTYMAYEVWLHFKEHFDTDSEQEHYRSDAGHLGGALAGILIGIWFLKSLSPHEWETKLRRTCLYIAGVLFVICLCINCGLQIAYFSLDSKDFAEKIFHVPYNNLTKSQKEEMN